MSRYTLAPPRPESALFHHRMNAASITAEHPSIGGPAVPANNPVNPFFSRATPQKGEHSNQGYTEEQIFVINRAASVSAAERTRPRQDAGAFQHHNTLAGLGQTTRWRPVLSPIPQRWRRTA